MRDVHIRVIVCVCDGTTRRARYENCSVFGRAPGRDDIVLCARTQHTTETSAELKRNGQPLSEICPSRHTVRYSPNTNTCARMLHIQTHRVGLRMCASDLDLKSGFAFYFLVLIRLLQQHRVMKMRSERARKECARRRDDAMQ